jgi:hypothetical protein
MSVIIKLLPIILISIVFYLLIYNLYPKYQELINLTKKLNELQNKEREINTLQKLIQTIAQNSNIQQLIANRTVLDLWLPQELKIEDIFASLVGVYQINNLVFKGVNIDIVSEPMVYNQNILPVKVIHLSFEAPLNNTNLLSFIEALEKNTRLMTIKKARISSNLSQFEVDSYYLSEK